MGLGKRVPPLLGHGHVVRIVECVILGRRDQWEMRSNEGHEQHPGLLFVRAFLFDPVTGFFGDFLVVLNINAVAGADFCGKLLALFAHGGRVSY